MQIYAILYTYTLIEWNVAKKNGLISQATFRKFKRRSDLSY